MTNAEKEKALIAAARTEAARLEKMGVRSQRIAYALNELADKAEESYNEGGDGARLSGDWADFICNSRNEHGINNVYDHFNKLSLGGCFIIYDEGIAEAYKWQPKRRPADGCFYLNLQANFLARAWQRVKEIQAKL